jgi:hypothetical protein
MGERVEKMETMNWLAKAESIQGWMTREELEWLYAAGTHMDTVVEVGAWKGRSTIALAASAKHVISVDTWQGTIAELGGMHAEALEHNIYLDWLENTAEFDNVKGLISRSVLAPEKIVDDKVDMVFIDAEHTKDAVIADITAWRGKCSKIICGHDFDRQQVRDAVFECFETSQVQKGAGSIWYVDLAAEIDTRELLAVAVPGPSFSRAWLAQWNELYVYLFKKFRLMLFYAESNNIYQVRNIIAKSISACREVPKYTLWIDSDNLVSVAGFEELYASISECPEVDAVGAWYRFFGPQGTLIAAGTGPNLRPTEEQLAGLPGLLQVGYIGFGFLLMKSSVIVELGDTAFLPYLENGEFCTDDGGFCDRATGLGRRFYVHPKVFAPHLKLGEVSAIRPIS